MPRGPPMRPCLTTSKATLIAAMRTQVSCGMIIKARQGKASVSGCDRHAVNIQHESRPTGTPRNATLELHPLGHRA